MKKKELKWHKIKDYDYPQESGDYLCYRNGEYFIAWFNKYTLDFIDNDSRFDRTESVDYWFDLTDLPSFKEIY